MAKTQGKNTSRIQVTNAENAFAQSEQERNGVGRERRNLGILGIIFVVILVLAWILPTFMFSNNMVDMTFAVFLDKISDNINGFLGVFVGNGGSYEVRFMEVLVCAVSGGALGLCGSAYQGAFNNPLAAPKTLGVMSGGALGALVWVLFLEGMAPTVETPEGFITFNQIQEAINSLSPLEWIYVYYGRSICCIVGCFVIVAIVVVISRLVGDGKLSNIIVIVAGQIIGGAISAIIMFARYVVSAEGGDEMAQELAAIENYTMINTFYFRDLLIVVLPILICIIITLAMRNRLTLLSFGDEVAATMGVNVTRTRYAMIAICTLMTALSISFCGHVAFLGFISAHISRKVVGSNFRYLLPASVLVGGSLFGLIQWLCSSGLPFTNQYAAGVLTSVIGAVVFLVMAFKQAKEGVSDWKKSQ